MPHAGVSRQAAAHSVRAWTFADVVAIAARAYGESRDRSGGLLLAHGVQVAQALGPGATPTAMNAALLHDVPEAKCKTGAALLSHGRGKPGAPRP